MLEVWTSQEQPPFQKEQFPEFYRRSFQSALAHLSTSPKWFESYWKEQLKKMFSPPDK